MNPAVKRQATALAMIGSALLGGLALAASGADEDAAARGSVSYRIYCSNCHGRSGQGDGKLARSLTKTPTNLTQLANRNGGAFPTERVRDFIDGRKWVDEHGDRDMPVWGATFAADAKDPETAVAAKLGDLVAYLASIQAPAEKKGG